MTPALARHAPSLAAAARVAAITALATDAHYTWRHWLIDGRPRCRMIAVSTESWPTIRAYFYEDKAVTLHHGDTLEVLRTLPDESVNCAVTSPPYFGLRDYGNPGQYGLEPSPAAYVDNMRAVFAEVRRVLAKDGTLWLNIGDSYVGSGSLGRNDAGRDFGSGNAGQGPGGNPGKQGSFSVRHTLGAKNLLGVPWRTAFALQEDDSGDVYELLPDAPESVRSVIYLETCRTKTRVLRLRKAQIRPEWLQHFRLVKQDRWILRNCIVWSKPNAMPESVTDRLSNRHELLFMFSRSRRYWFDLDPIREAQVYADGAPQLSWARDSKEADVPGQSMRQHRKQRSATEASNQGTGLAPHSGYRGTHSDGRNPGDVWTIPTTPFPGAHFAVFPPEIPRRCILAGCAPRVCRDCGHKPEPTKERGGMDMSRPQAKRAMEIATEHGLTEEHFAAIRSAGATDAGKAAVTQSGTGKNTARVTALALEAKKVLRGYYREFLLDRLVTNGWTDCGHGAYEAGTVLDPFSGSGTTGMVAGQVGRKYVGIDLSADYLRLSLETRLAQTALLDGESA